MGIYLGRKVERCDPMWDEISLFMNRMRFNRDQEVRAEKGLEDHEGRDQNTGKEEEMHHVE